jgi:predicted RNA binding protein with dsRBD fold (UPF0201 family)
MNELLEKWAEFKQTATYKQVLLSSQASSLGMNFLGLNSDIFTAFMDWLTPTTSKDNDKGDVR